jgi:hypothetical protein
MSVTINFVAPTESDISLVNVYESVLSTGEFSLVYSSGITTSSTTVIYDSGVSIYWYKISFSDIYENESQLSAAIYGGGESWTEYILPLMRTQLADWGTTQTYSDDELKKRLVISAWQLYQMANVTAPFSVEYSFTISNDSDPDAWDIQPDPIYGSVDKNFLNLWILKTNADITKSGYLSNAGNAIKVKDGDTSIDTSASLGGYKDIMGSEYGAPATFEFAWYEYLRGNMGSQVLTHFGSDLEN